MEKGQRMKGRIRIGHPETFGGMMRLPGNEPKPVPGRPLVWEMPDGQMITTPAGAIPCIRRRDTRDPQIEPPKGSVRYVYDVVTVPIQKDAK